MGWTLPCASFPDRKLNYCTRDVKIADHAERGPYLLSLASADGCGSSRIPKLSTCRLAIRHQEAHHPLHPGAIDRRTSGTLTVDTLSP